MANPNPNLEQPETNPNPFEFMNFDTHKSIKLLVKQGFKEPQAEAVVDLVSQSRNYDLSKLSTKEQLSKLENSTKDQFSKFESSTKERFTKLEAKVDALDTKIDTVEERFENKMDLMEARLKALITEKVSKLQETVSKSSTTNTRWMVSILIALAGVGAAVAAVLLKS